MTAIVVRSKRPGQAEWGYHNRFPGDNAEVSGSSGYERDKAYAKLWEHALMTASKWKKLEPDTVFEVIDEDKEEKKGRRR